MESERKVTGKRGKGGIFKPYVRFVDLTSPMANGVYDIVRWIELYLSGWVAGSVQRAVIYSLQASPQKMLCRIFSETSNAIILDPIGLLHCGVCGVSSYALNVILITA